MVRNVSVLFVALLASLLAAQQPQPADPSSSDAIQLNVTVDTKSGQPAVNLGQQDFTILDNKTPRPITSFKVMSPAQEPVRVILFIDAVNVPLTMLSNVRDGVGNYLKAREGQVAHPTALAVLTDKGAAITTGFSTNGLVLNDNLKHQAIGLREINRSSDWGENERLQICLNAIYQLLAYSSTLPGRKIILWISPGWPLMPAPEGFLTSKQERQIFGSIVSFSTQMRRNNVTLYDINPVGPSESIAQSNFYQGFLKGIAKPGDAQMPDLGLQVIADHSGGLALESNNDIAAQIQRCLTDLQSWYAISFDPLPSDKPDIYHHIEIKLTQHDLVARTLDGYYANTRAIQTAR
jgi:VWFA-related protein